MMTAHQMKLKGNKLRHNCTLKYSGCSKYMLKKRRLVALLFNVILLTLNIINCICIVLLFFDVREIDKRLDTKKNKEVIELIKIKNSKKNILDKSKLIEIQNENR